MEQCPALCDWLNILDHNSVEGQKHIKIFAGIKLTQDCKIWVLRELAAFMVSVGPISQGSDKYKEYFNCYWLKPVQYKKSFKNIQIEQE